MGRIITLKEFEEKKKGEEQRQRGIKPLKPVSLSQFSPVGELTLVEDVEEPAPDKPKGLLDVLNEDIETNYHEYLKLEKALGEFDTTLADVPQSIKPSIIANYNKVVNKFNSLVTTLQTDVKKRDEIISVLKKQEFVTRKHLEEQEVSTQKTTRHAGLQSSSILDKPSMGGALGISQTLDLDKINKYVAAPLKGVKHGIYSTPQAVGGLMRMLGENMQATEGTQNIFTGDDKKYKDLVDKKMQKPETHFDQLLVDKSQEIITANREFLKKKELYPDMDDKLVKWLFSLGSGSVSLAGAIGISILIHSPHAAAIAFGIYQTGSIYQEEREADVRVGKATPLAIAAGVIEGALEYIGLQWLFIKFGGNFCVNRLLHAGLEGFQEWSQQTGENLVAMIGWDGTRNLFQNSSESASIGAVLGFGMSAITANVDKNIDLKGLTDKQKKSLIEVVVNKQLEAITKIIPNLNPATIMEKVKTDPDIQKAILGVFEAEQEVVTEAMEVEPKEPTTPKELEAKREMLRKQGVRDEKLLADDEWVAKAHVTELPKADVTGEEIIPEEAEIIKRLMESKAVSEEKITKEKVLEKVEKPNVEPKELGEKFEGKAFRAETHIPEHGAEIIGKMKTAKEKLDYDYGTTGNEIFKNAQKIAEELGIDVSKVPIKEMLWVAPDLKTAEKYGEAKEIKLTEDTIILAKDEEGGFLVLKNIDKYKAEPKEPNIIREELKQIKSLTAEDKKIIDSISDDSITFIQEMEIKPPITKMSDKEYLEFRKSIEEEHGISRYEMLDARVLPAATTEGFKITFYGEPSRATFWHEMNHILPINVKITEGKFKGKVVKDLAKELELEAKKEEPPKKPLVPPKKIAEQPELQPEPEPEFNKDVKIKDVYTIGERTPAKKVKGKIRAITGQTKQDKILIAELDLLDLVLKGQEKAAKKAFSEGQKKGIFKQKEHFKDIVARAKERKAQKDYVNKLIKDINNLPTKNVHIDYKDKIEAIKEVFDLKKRTQKTLHTREETAKFIEKEMEAGNTNLNIPQETIDLIKKKPLNDMTITELENIHDTIKQLAHIGTLKGKMIKIQKGKKIDELANDLVATLYKDKINKISQEKHKLDFDKLNKKQKQDIIKDFQEKTRNIKQEIKDISGIKKKVKNVWSHFWVNTTLDESLFEKMDGEERLLWWETFYNTINKCTNTELLATFDKIAKIRNFFDDNKIDNVKFLQERTGNLMLTHSQRAGLYLCSLDEDAKRHIQKAGVIIKKGLEPYMFTDKDIENEINNLTKEEKAVSKLYQEYQLTQEKELDEFDVRVRGVHLKGVKNRFAIQVLGNEMYNSAAVELERNPTSRRAYMEEGFRKPRTHRAENVIMLDCITNMLRDITKVEHYKAFKEAEIDINNLLSNPQLKKAIFGNPKYGRIAYDNITQWFKDSVKAKQGKVLSTSDVVMNWFRTSAFISMLGLNIISGSKQLVSLSNAVALTDLRTILSGIEQVSLHYNETKQFVFQRDPQMRARKGTIDKIMQEWMETDDAKQILTGVTGDIRMKQLFLIRALDEFAVLSVWKGSYDSVMNTHKIGGKEIKFKDVADLERQATEHAAYIVRKTQPFALMKDLPQWFRDGTVAKMFSLFQNQINKNQNLIRDTFRQFGAGKISTGVLAHRMIFGWFLPAALIGMITRGRPPEDWKELVGDMAVYYAGGWFFVGAIAWNIMQGYGGYCPAPIAFMQELIKVGTYKTTESKVKKGISAFCKVVGLSYNQPYRTIEGAEDWITGETDDARRLIWSKYVLGEDEKKYTPVGGKPGKPSKPGRPSKPKKYGKPKRP